MEVETLVDGMVDLVTLAQVRGKGKLTKKHTRKFPLTRCESLSLSYRLETKTSSVLHRNLSKRLHVQNPW